jgi:hypothetical protein
MPRPTGSTLLVPGRLDGQPINRLNGENPAQGGPAPIPGGITPPLTSAINFSAARTLANNAVVGVAGDGMATLSVCNDMPSGTVQLILDVNGYFQ